MATYTYILDTLASARATAQATRILSENDEYILSHLGIYIGGRTCEDVANELSDYMDCIC